MGRGVSFWGVILILIGGLLLLYNLGYLAVNVWVLIWPLFLIVLGLWFLWGVVFGRRGVEAEEAVIPLEGAGRAHLRIRHGAGRLKIDAGAGPDELVTGTFGGGLDYRARRREDLLDVDMRVPADVFPHFWMPWDWFAGGGLDWSLGLNSEIPFSLDLETGAVEMRLNLADLRVTDLRVKTGASATYLTLPASAGHTQTRIEAGAASVVVLVPDGVAARIHVQGALAGINVDKSRFPRMGKIYQSPDYDTAPNKADIEVEAGVGSIEIG